MLALLMNLGFAASSSGFVPPPNPPMAGASGGGGGSIDYQTHRRKAPGLRKQLDDILEDSARELYAKLIANKETQAPAAKLVKPFTQDKRAAVPLPDTVDWAAVERDVTRTRCLLALAAKLEHQRQIDDDDDEFMMLN